MSFSRFLRSTIFEADPMAAGAQVDFEERNADRSRYTIGHNIHPASEMEEDIDGGNDGMGAPYDGAMMPGGPGGDMGGGMPPGPGGMPDPSQLQPIQPGMGGPPGEMPPNPMQEGKDDFDLYLDALLDENVEDLSEGPFDFIQGGFPGGGFPGGGRYRGGYPGGGGPFAGGRRWGAYGNGFPGGGGYQQGAYQGGGYQPGPMGGPNGPGPAVGPRNYAGFSGPQQPPASITAAGPGAVANWQSQMGRAGGGRGEYSGSTQDLNQRELARVGGGSYGGGDAPAGRANPGGRRPAAAAAPPGPPGPKPEPGPYGKSPGGGTTYQAPFTPKPAGNALPAGAPTDAFGMLPTDKPKTGDTGTYGKSPGGGTTYQAPFTPKPEAKPGEGGINWSWDKGLHRDPNGGVTWSWDKGLHPYKPEGGGTAAAAAPAAGDKMKYGGETVASAPIPPAPQTGGFNAARTGTGPTQIPSGQPPIGARPERQPGPGTTSTLAANRDAPVKPSAPAQPAPVATAAIPPAPQAQPAAPAAMDKVSSTPTPKESKDWGLDWSDYNVLHESDRSRERKVRGY